MVREGKLPVGYSGARTRETISKLPEEGSKVEENHGQEEKEKQDKRKQEGREQRNVRRKEQRGRELRESDEIT